MNLFDDKPRNFMGYRQTAEPSYLYLDQTARPEFVKIREMLEQWFSHFPEGDDKKNLCRRFRSPIEVHHDAAFFELLIHETLLRLGCKPEPHPVLPSVKTNPDFLVRSAKGDFFLEALVVTDESGEEASARQRWGELYDRINSLKSKEFALSLTYQGIPKSNVPTKEWVKQVKDFLGQHDRQEVMAMPIDDRPDIEFEHDGLKASFKLIPKNYPDQTTEDEPRIWSILGPTEWIETSLEIRDKMKRKAKKYGAMDIPYVLAVNVKRGWGMENQYMDGLFGDDAIQYLENGKSIPVRTGEGLWFKGGKPKRQNVSAALFFGNALEANLPIMNPILYHNPWAFKPYSGELAIFTQMVPQSEYAYKKIDGARLTDVFKEAIGFQDITPIEFKLGDEISKALERKPELEP